jgi:hypothetical protein
VLLTSFVIISVKIDRVGNINSKHSPRQPAYRYFLRLYYRKKLTPFFNPVFLRIPAESCMTIVIGAILLAPVALFSLMAQLVSCIGFNALMGMGSCAEVTDRPLTDVAVLSAGSPGCIQASSAFLPDYGSALCFSIVNLSLTIHKPFSNR